MTSHLTPPARRPPAPAAGGEQLALDLGFDQREADIAAIHRATGVYTVRREVQALLDKLGWPARGRRLLDPAAGDGGFLVAALSRLDLHRDDSREAAWRVKGYEFYAPAAAAARRAVRDHLTGRGWSAAAARQAASAIVEERDFLLSPVPAGTFDTIAANPPYLRLARLPAAYRAEYEAAVPDWARQDLLYAFLARSADIITGGGLIGLITADRWFLNSGASQLRRRLGQRYRVADLHRLDAASSFYVPKDRRKDTPPRVHPVSFTLTPGEPGRQLDARPFRLASLPNVDGVPLAEIAEIRLAPYLGRDGIFLLDLTQWLLPDGSFRCDDPAGLPAAMLAPAVEPADITKDGQIRPPRKWVLLTSRDEEPPAPVLAHLDRELHRMPARGRRDARRWLPPEPFDRRLPLDHDTVLVPRIATRLRAILLPAGRVPVNHQLVVVSGLPAATIITMLEDPLVQAQADALALRVDGGFASFTATLLRELVIPRHHLAAPAGT